MGQKKLQRFREIKTFYNVLEYPENIAGRWKEHFKNTHPIVLELACGKGEYATGLAQLYPNKNFIGIDIKGNRMWVGAAFSLKNNLNNVAFLRTQIHQVDTYFDKDEVNEIWIIFPDPQLRISKAKKRLTHPRYIRLYKKILQSSGKIHLKTDSPDLYRFTKMVIELYKLILHEDNDDIYKENTSAELSIKTYYEGLDIAGTNKVFYLCFSLPAEIEGNDEMLNAIIKEHDETK